MKFTRVVALFCVFGSAVTARAESLSSVGIGVYGDSLSMQYSFWLPLAPSFNYDVYYNGTQLNWVDQLVKAGYNFGPTATYDGEKYKTYDAAVSGDTTVNLADQASNLQPQVTSGAIGLVVQIIGSDDFNDVGPTSEYQTIYNNAAKASYNPLTDPSVIAFEKGLIANITASLEQTLAENPHVHMILGTIPNLGISPLYESEYPSATQRAAVAEVIEAVNSQIIALGAQFGFPVVDLFGLANLSLTETTFAGLTMKDTGGDSGKDMFLSDGFHPGTVLQGILGDAILEADNVAYGDTVTLLSEQTIAESAGLTPKGPSPTYFDVSPYVIYSASVPEPATIELALVGLGFLAAAAARRRCLLLGRHT